MERAAEPLLFPLSKGHVATSGARVWVTRDSMEGIAERERLVHADREPRAELRCKAGIHDYGSVTARRWIFARKVQCSLDKVQCDAANARVSTVSGRD